MKPRPTAAPRVLARLGAVAIVLLLLLAPGTARSQEPDTVIVAPATPLFARQGDPPISPRRAFLFSLVLPGLAQAKLDRGNAAALFTSAEAFSVGMLVKSYYDLGVAKRYRRDSIPTVFTLDPVSGEFVPGGLVAGPFSAGLVRARRLHAEDWIAALALTHLLSAIDAFVAAQLWDIPVDIEVGSTGRGSTIAAGFRW